MSICYGVVLVSFNRFALLDSTDENYEFYYNVNADPNWGLRGSNGYRLQVTPSVLNARHSVKAFFVKPIQMKIRHTYDFLHEAYLNVLVTAENNVTVPALTDTQLVEVQVVIANLTIADTQPGISFIQSSRFSSILHSL